MDAAASTVPVSVRNNGFYLGMSVAIAATVIGGFGSFALRGFVDVGRVPYWVHVHGAVFVSWTLLFVMQNAFAHRGSMALHRRMGWVAVGLATAMVPLGVVTVCMAVVLDRVPPFFTPTIFLALSVLELIGFITLLTGAIRLRRSTEWHRRLMLCAMVAIIGPAFGRLLPMPLLGPWGGLAVMSGQMLFVAVGVVHDLASRGRVHPAYAVGAAVILAEGLAVPILAATPPIVWLASALAG
ncbi:MULTISPECIES: hypothetical protein [unclassified Sphingobium]|uniref:hypothetical protein n=1 Tax=unclassified Sphingobium TaxID=2611147 RepID=UPI0007701786|nr:MULTISPECIES: hypothetical protein [Sphingomonadaceae]AMK22145.1 hypothetical protein K426_05985 [Sphingobium sp. TKS]NML88228.1 hypothetical protein [Sphingobium sp. TB-6]